MNKKLFTTIICIGLLLLFAEFSPPNKTAPNGVAVVELFTAEGCSSCPPADELLKEMTEILQKEGRQVLALSFHVTYWNRLGWEDPYSQELFTERQKMYVSKLKVGQLYTPQAIVNGEQEFVGSNPVAFRNAVVTATDKAVPYSILADLKVSEGKAIVRYQLEKEPRNITLNAVIVKKHVEHFIPRGENKDRTLRHYNVVLKLVTVEAKASGELRIDWPADLPQEKESVILYLQNSKSLKIVGGCQL